MIICIFLRWKDTFNQRAEQTLEHKGEGNSIYSWSLWNDSEIPVQETGVLESRGRNETVYSC